MGSDQWPPRLWHRVGLWVQELSSLPSTGNVFTIVHKILKELSALGNCVVSFPLGLASGMKLPLPPILQPYDLVSVGDMTSLTVELTFESADREGAILGYPPEGPQSHHHSAAFMVSEQTGEHWQG